VLGALEAARGVIHLDDRHALGLQAVGEICGQGRRSRHHDCPPN
jgi:hypothetical protein